MSLQVHEEDALVLNVYFVTQWLPCWEYSMHRQEGIPLSVHILSGGLFWFVHTTSVSIHQNQTTLDPSVRSCGHLCGCPSGYAEGPRETQRRRRQLSVSPECWGRQMASWLIFWSSPNSLSPSLPLGVRGVQRGTCLLDPRQPNPPQMSSCYSCALQVWFMNGNHQEYSFWQPKQIMERRLTEAICDLSLAINLHRLLAHWSQKSSARNWCLGTIGLK